MARSAVAKAVADRQASGAGVGVAAHEFANCRALTPYVLLFNRAGFAERTVVALNEVRPCQSSRLSIEDPPKQTEEVR